MNSSSVLTEARKVSLIVGCFCNSIVGTSEKVSIGVSAVTAKFIDGFLLTVEPRVLRGLTRGGCSRLCSLVFCNAEFSCCLMLVVSVPVVLRTPLILGL